MNSLNNRCHRLRKTENKNMNNIGELTNKIQILENELLKKKEMLLSYIIKNIKY